MKSYWRQKASPIIAKVIHANPDLDDKELKKLISKEYPFGPRSHHPYKIWLSEVKRQMETRHAKLMPQVNQELIDDLPLFGGSE